MRKILALILALGMLSGMAAAEGVEPGTLRIAVLYDISTMDVARTTDNYMVPMNVFDRLLETRPEGDASKVVGSLATDYTVSGDGLTYSFTLREGVAFSNGSPLTASDVQFSFERLLKLHDQNTDIPLEVVGGREVMEGAAEHLAGFTVADDTHFSVTLTAANAGFPAELTAPAMSIVDAETMSEGFGRIPAETVGTGPYIVTEWVANDHYTLVFNEKYWGPAPDVRKVIVLVEPTAATQSYKFKSGELDLIDLQNLDSAVIAAEYKTMPEGRVVSRPRVGINFMMMNEKNGFLGDVRVRKAISMAIDVDQIITGIYSGDALRENGIIPNGVWAHNDRLEAPAYDPEGAKALLREAGYGEGQVAFELAEVASATDSIKLVNLFVSQQLRAVGIDARIQSYDHAAWLAKRGAGEMDAFIARWGMDYNDPANIMYTFFGSVENTVGRSLNYPDTAVIDRVAAARAIVDDAAREAEYQALEKKLIQEDAVWVPMFAELHLYAIGDRVASFTPQWAGFTDFFAADVALK